MRRNAIGAVALAAAALLAMAAMAPADAKLQGSGGPRADVVLDQARIARQYRAADAARRPARVDMRRNVADGRAASAPGAAGHPG